VGQAWRNFPAAMEKAKAAKLLYDSGTRTGEIAKILGIYAEKKHLYIAPTPALLVDAGIIGYACVNHNKVL
jgi:hypothetical protein